MPLVKGACQRASTFHIRQVRCEAVSTRCNADSLQAPSCGRPPGPTSAGGGRARRGAYVHFRSPPPHWLRQRRQRRASFSTCQLGAIRVVKARPPSLVLCVVAHSPRRRRPLCRARMLTSLSIVVLVITRCVITTVHAPPGAWRTSLKSLLARYPD